MAQPTLHHLSRTLSRRIRKRIRNERTVPVHSPEHRYSTHRFAKRNEIANSSRLRSAHDGRTYRRCSSRLVPPKVRRALLGHRPTLWTEWSLWYEHPDGHTTSNMLDRLMRRQNDYFDRGQHFHGGVSSSNLRSRSWAILHNYWPWGLSRCRRTVERVVLRSDGTAHAIVTVGSPTSSLPPRSEEQKNTPQNTKKLGKSRVA